MTTWQSPPKPADYAENRLIEAILDGYFPIDSYLPAERELSEQLGVTRPTLREALQRLSRDGWLEIHQGRPTRVRNYWQEGNLGVLGAIARQSQKLPPDFVTNLLSVRCLLAPAYARLSVERAPQVIASLLRTYQTLPDQSEDFAAADWKLHHQLTIYSGNPIFTLILNGFSELYSYAGQIYFASARSRQHSSVFYRDLMHAAQNQDATQAEAITRKVMQDSLELWQDRTSG